MPFLRNTPAGYRYGALAFCAWLILANVDWSAVHATWYAALNLPHAWLVTLILLYGIDVVVALAD